jgi:hypothetical protein
LRIILKTSGTGVKVPKEMLWGNPHEAVGVDTISPQSPEYLDSEDEEESAVVAAQRAIFVSQ